MVIIISTPHDGNYAGTADVCEAGVRISLVGLYGQYSNFLRPGLRQPLAQPYHMRICVICPFWPFGKITHGQHPLADPRVTGLTPTAGIATLASPAREAMVSERIQRQIERLLGDAEEALTRRDWQAVFDAAQHVLTIDPDNADAQAFVTIAGRALKAAPVLTAQGPSAPTLSPTVEQPTTFASGRYQVQLFLGEGGKKRVYVAHDSVVEAMRIRGVYP